MICTKEQPILKIGDMIYTVKIEYTKLSGKQEKIKMIDSYGVEWYRYNVPSLIYTIAPHSIVGIVKYSVEGKLTDYSDNIVDGDIMYVAEDMTTSDFEEYRVGTDIFYTSIDQAKASIEGLENKENNA